VRSVGSRMKQVVVIGIGNVLTGDDALGPTAVLTLDALWDLPDGVEVIDGGTPGMDLATMIADVDGLIVVDSALAEGPPGTVKSWDHETLLAKPLTPRTNPHAPGLLETLWTMRLIERGPSEVRLIGVVPAETEVGIGMCDAVRDAVPTVVRMVIDTLAEWGFEARPATPPRNPALWWEAATTPPGAHAVGRRTPAPSAESEIGETR